MEWKGHQCYGRCGLLDCYANIVTIVTEPVTFTGDGYARYTLLDSVLDSGIAKRQVTMEMAFYEESISMRVQTNAEEGLLFQMSGANDFAVLEVYHMHVEKIVSSIGSPFNFYRPLVLFPQQVMHTYVSWDLPYRAKL